MLSITWILKGCLKFDDVPPNKIPLKSSSFALETDFIILASLNVTYTVDTTRIKPFSTYVCTEKLFDSPQFVYNNIFLKKYFYWRYFCQVFVKLTSINAFEPLETLLDLFSSATFSSEALQFTLKKQERLSWPQNRQFALGRCF